MKRHFFALLIFVWAGSACGSYAQNAPNEYLQKKEQEIVVMADSMNTGGSLRTRMKARRQLDTALLNVLDTPQSFAYPFDSLGQYLSILRDTLYPLRVFTWQLRFPDHIEYFGCLQLPDTVIAFKPDNQNTIASNYEKRTASNWVGALFYSLIPVDVGHRGASYILLGLQRPNMYEKQKLIEVMKISPDRTVHFGAPVFDEGGTADRKLYRYPLRYASDGYVSLRYDSAYRAILFDHLIPIGRNPTGETKWGSDGSYSAFKIVYGHLVYVPKVFNYNSEKPPITEKALRRRKDLDLFGRPRKPIGKSGKIPPVAK